MGACICIVLLKTFITGKASLRNIKYSLESGFSRLDVILCTVADLSSVLLKYERRASYCSSKRSTHTSRLSHLVCAALSNLWGLQWTNA